MIRELSEHEVKALHYELLLKDIITTAEKLPPFPDIAWKVMSLIKRMAPVHEIEAVIKYDQAITARVLSLSQSAYYGRRYHIRSLHDAILLLGGQTLVQVIMAACASRYFEGKISGHDVRERELWNHSVATGLMGELIAKRLKHKKVLTIYTASLLHDIGKTVLDLYAKIYLHSTISQIREVRKEGVQFIDAERKALGIDHQELGEIISRRWRFPGELVVGIGFHHSPHRAPSDRDVAAVVYAANQITHGMEMEGEKNTIATLLERDLVLSKLGITAQMIHSLQAEVQGAMAEVNQQVAPH